MVPFDFFFFPLPRTGTISQAAARRTRSAKEYSDLGSTQPSVTTAQLSHSSAPTRSARKRCRVRFPSPFKHAKLWCRSRWKERKSYSLCPVRSLNKMLTGRQSKNVYKGHLFMKQEPNSRKNEFGSHFLALKGTEPAEWQAAARLLLPPLGLRANYFASLNPFLPLSLTEDDRTRTALLTGLFKGSKEMRCRKTLWSV